MLDDAAAAAEWLGGRPGEVTDQLIRSAASKWASSDRETAALAVVEIGDPALRAIAAEEIAKALRWKEAEIEMADEVREALEAMKR